MLRLVSALIFLTACDLTPFADEYQTEQGSADAAVVIPDAAVAADAALPPLPPAPAFLVSPQNGQVVAGSLTESGLQLHGYTPVPSAPVRLQVLEYGPGLTLPARWATFAVATSAATPEAGTTLYPWLSTASPVTERTWIAGGVMRVRAVDAAGQGLVTFDADASACFTGRPLAEALLACRSGFGDVAIVHTGGAPEDKTRFLDLKGLGDAAETAAYYLAIDAPTTLAAFRARFGFDVADNGEVEAVYYNAGDLGIGREMHCRAFAVAGQVAPGIACWVSNYGTFGGPLEDALDAAVARTGAFATVAMVYRPPIAAPDSVQFMVYGADGALVTSAPLDTHADNASIPQNCLNCHGGHATYDAIGHRVLGGARFLPFDPGAFVFADVAGLRRADQEEALRKLNALVERSGATAATRELISALYGGKVDAPGARADENAVPPSWSQTAADRRLYQSVIRPACRACHISQEPLTGRTGLDFASAQAFRALAPAIERRICGPHAAANQRMPSAEVPLDAFWRSGARGYLVAYLGLHNVCPP